MPNVKTKLPDTSQAEGWLDEETFIVDGKLYRFTPDMEVVPVEDNQES